MVLFFLRCAGGFFAFCFEVGDMTITDFQPLFDLLCGLGAVVVFALGYIGGYLQ